MQFPKSMLSGYTALLQFLFSFFYITSCVVLFKLKLFRLFHSSNLTFHDISIFSLILEYVLLYKCNPQVVCMEQPQSRYPEIKLGAWPNHQALGFRTSLLFMQTAARI